MKFAAEITLTADNIPALRQCFDAEIPSMQSSRSTVQVHTTRNTLQFSVTAQDATALRATVNSITKLITVFEKASQNE
jgi:tRNA threonylcarbamoyladenosine modification (KEOPS) complex  Pcc1 subunit